MIKNRRDYKDYLLADSIALGITQRKFYNWIFNPIYRYECALRRHEYYYNCIKQPWLKPLIWISGYFHRSLGVKLGYSIPINVFEKGLSIAHVGTIVVNPNVRVGENCRIHVCTNIGVAAGGNDNQCPTLGKNVYIAPGVKIFGPISIADNIAIGANAVVNKDFLEEDITIAGIPAQKISDKGSNGLL